MAMSIANSIINIYCVLQARQFQENAIATQSKYPIQSTGSHNISVNDQPYYEIYHKLLEHSSRMVFRSRVLVYLFYW